MERTKIFLFLYAFLLGLLLFEMPYTVRVILFSIYSVVGLYSFYLNIKNPPVVTKVRLGARTIINLEMLLGYILAAVSVVAYEEKLDFFEFIMLIFTAIYILPLIRFK